MLSVLAVFPSQSQDLFEHIYHVQKHFLQCINGVKVIWVIAIIELNMTHEFNLTCCGFDSLLVHICV